MTAPKRVLTARLNHETHTFLDGVTGIGEFVIRRDGAVLPPRGNGSQLDGIREVAETEGWELIPTVDFGAPSTATVDHAVFEQFWVELEARLNHQLQIGPIDAILLVLHGAMVTTQCVDPEGELLARLRARPELRAIPIFGCFDLHANFTERMATFADCLVGYRHNPHTDVRETAVRAARMLARTLKTGVRPRMHVRHAPVIWPPGGTGTNDRPMRDLMALASRIEAQHPDIWCCNVIGGYSFADVPEAGVAFSLVTTGDEHAAGNALDKLVALATELRTLGVPDEIDIDAAISAAQGKPGLYCFIEPADNIGGGGPGDCTDVLRAFLRHRLSRAAVAIADPESVVAFEGALPGEVCRVAIGGKRSRLDAGPVVVDATFVSRSDGDFTLEDPHSPSAGAGSRISMGPCVVLRVGEGGGVTVLLTSRKTSPNDLGQWRSQGIAPEELSFIGIKAAVAWKQAYSPIMAGAYVVRTRGPCASDPRTLPYRRLRRPIFPLDAI